LAKRGLRIIAIDTPGYGMSDNFDHPPTSDEYAGVVATVMDGLKLTKASVVGHHTGSTVGSAFAARYPDRVDRVVMHGVPLYTNEERAERLARPHFDQTPDAEGNHLKRRWEVGLRLAPDASLEALHLSAVNFFMAGPLEWHGHHAAFTHDMAAALKAIKAPTLIMSNTGDMLHFSLERVRALRPDFKFLSLDGGTYHIVFDEAERWAKPVGDFILGAA